MTSYITITDEETDPGAPITSELLKKERDNPIAMAEGASGAPRILIGALQRLNAGNEIRVRSDEEIPNGVILYIGFIQKGTVRISFSHSSSAGTTTAVVKRIRGGVETVLASYNVGTTFVARTVDCPVLPGDSLIVSSTGLITLCRMMTNGEDYFPVSVNRGTPEGNTYA